MTKHKCFISFEIEDNAYKEQIQASESIDMIDKSLNEPINSDNPDYVMQKIRDNNLKDSSVTIFLIGSFSAEIIGEKEQYYIKKELQASLYHSLNHGRNGILGIVLPDMYSNIYKGKSKQPCQICGGFHDIVCIDDSTTIKEFSANYYIQKGHTSCAWSEDQRYCVLTRWDDFILDPNRFINAAWEKRDEDIAQKITVYPK